MSAEHTPQPSKPVIARSAAGAATLATVLAALLAGAPQAAATEAPASPKAPAASTVSAAHDAVTAPGTLDSLARFFARDGAVAKAKAQPRVEGATVPVYTLSPGFVADASGAGHQPIATMDFLASKAVSADGQVASVWTAHTGGSWKVVNIATGGDETYYAAKGAKKLGGGTVFREPQIDAWYVQRGAQVLPLDTDAVQAIGAGGMTVDAYRKRVHTAYADKLPGSAYADKGKAGGYEQGPGSAPAASGATEAMGEARDAKSPNGADNSHRGSDAKSTVRQNASAATGGEDLLTATSALTALAALVALGLSGAVALRLRRR
ncbi:hypothetical protein [Streptomyces zagrosensis]|uniref:Gram-positive cocci surface proteins LPxTG domain-containing protein n=1 Tax=Streptomyces zagrosensis TaxID=1042984 RepID=A0A7W9Q6T0_9ACTN|nr:hypothetical protein [Streptomyces zagrosensis]MBB5933607.1 hypothetical protein [Streptomyces zagrosensis]